MTEINANEYHIDPEKTRDALRDYEIKINEYLATEIANGKNVICEKDMYKAIELPFDIVNEKFLTVDENEIIEFMSDDFIDMSSFKKTVDEEADAN